jgi:hypothetical protein
MLVFATVTLYGLFKHGAGFLKLFVPDGVPLILTLVLIEVISYVSRPVSHSVRLLVVMPAGQNTLKVFAGFVVSMAGLGTLLTALELLIRLCRNRTEAWFSRSRDGKGRGVKWPGIKEADMQISGIMNTALQGMNTETARADRAARNIAGASPAGDPALDMLDIVSAEIGFRANAAVFETGADLWDVLATIKRD